MHSIAHFTLNKNSKKKVLYVTSETFTNELIEALKQAEHQLADQYFPRDAAAIDKYHNYRSVNTVADQLPGLPADMLGLFAKGQGNTSLEEFHNEGRVLQETYEKAQKTYETLMTTPRSDLGDSIEKAFTNIDEILKDLGMETSVVSSAVSNSNVQR